MKLAISNIAWPHVQEQEALRLISRKGFQGIEIAPSRIWGDFRNISLEDRRAYKKLVATYHLEICSMHSLFFGTEGIGLFGQPEARQGFTNYFRALIDLAHDLEIPRMIFGSPSVRRRDRLSFEQAVTIAADVLFPVAEYAYRQGTKILIEPLSSEEADFIESHGEGIALVEAIGSKGFGLHLDAKAISSERSEIEAIFADCRGRFEHFHVNEAGLGTFKHPTLSHESIARELKKCRYAGYVSIEMREWDNPMEEVRAALDFVSSVYGEAV